MAETIEQLLGGSKSVEVPKVDLAKKRREGRTTISGALDVVIAEGCYMFLHPGLVELAAVKV
jgi:uridine kinase